MTEIYSEDMHLGTIKRTEASVIPVTNGLPLSVARIALPGGISTQIFDYRELAGTLPEFGVLADVIQGESDPHALEFANDLLAKNAGADVFVAFPAAAGRAEQDRPFEKGARAARLLEILKDEKGDPIAVVADREGDEKILPPHIETRLYVAPKKDLAEAARRSLMSHAHAHAS